MSVFLSRIISDAPLYNSVLENNTWEQISEASASGQAANYWAVGDTKSFVSIEQRIGAEGVELIESQTFYVFILGFNHNFSLEGNNLIHFQLGFNPLNNKKTGLINYHYGKKDFGEKGDYAMTVSETLRMGWRDCQMRTHILNSNASSALSPSAHSLLSIFPEEIRKVMKKCTKYTDNEGKEGQLTANNISSTQDYLWLLSPMEVFGEEKTLVSDCNPNEIVYQQQYEFYKKNLNYDFYNQQDEATQIAIWLRSPAPDKSVTQFIYIKEAGVLASRTGWFSQGIVPAFCI